MQPKRRIPLRLILGVSDVRGVEVAHFTIGHFNSNDFSVFLRKIVELGGSKPHILLDNAPWHRSKKTAETMELLGISHTFNAPLSPEKNAVEYVFSVLKNKYRKKRFAALVRGEEMDEETIMLQLLGELQRSKIESTVNKVMSLWRLNPGFSPDSIETF